MRLLRIEIKGARLFEEECLDMDFFASDRVVHDEDGRVADVTQVGSAGSIYSQNVIGITGVNASGKTTALNLVRFVLRYMAGPYAMRQPYYGSGRIGKLGPSLSATVVFWEDGYFYQLVSRLECNSLSSGPSSQDGDGGDELAFREETLWQLVAKRPTRLMIESSGEFQANARIILRRNGDPADPTVISEDSRVFLSDQTSIVSKVTGKGLVQVRSTSGRLAEASMPTQVVQAFDASIEYLSWDSKSQVYRLKFKGEEERSVSPEVARHMLSSGTIAGAEMVTHAIEVLKDGGYFIVDEIEDSLNRSLVGVVMDLFASPVTNPKGAQLVFSTHYPELLDLMRRKDNVYVLTRTDDFKTRVVKYSKEIKRIENKKSEVILHNIIKGSMPRYPDVRAMRDYVRERVEGRANDR